MAGVSEDQIGQLELRDPIRRAELRPARDHCDDCAEPEGAKRGGPR
jgi:hypothetical protein